MTTAGPFAISYPATALTIRSGPVRDGLSVTTRMPVSDSGVTINGSVWRYLIMPLVRECMISGTTEAMITSRIPFGSMALCSSMPQTVIPYSSDVRGRFVVIRNIPRSISSRKTPIVIFVFPTSIVSSISIPPRHLSTNVNCNSYLTKHRLPPSSAPCIPRHNNDQKKIRSGPLLQCSEPYLFIIMNAPTIFPPIPHTGPAQDPLRQAPPGSDVPAFLFEPPYTAVLLQCN